MLSAGTRSRSDRGGLEMADILRAHGDLLGTLDSVRSQAVAAIIQCRTAALGGHVYECDGCGHQEVSYNSCRNRHCPKCQRLQKARWVEARKKDLLPVEYHHVVFTIPTELHPFFNADPKTAIDLLFGAVSETLQDVALNPRRLGAKIGFTSVLHTWTQTLLFHPHIHCIVPGGGLSPDGERWISAKPGFLLPVRVLSTVFRGKLLERFENAFSAKGPNDTRRFLKQAARKKWTVFSKPPMAGPEQVLDYLGKYTHRIAISNRRLVSLRDGNVTFRHKDRANGNREKLLTLEAGEFLRRFLLHVLPRNLVRIRHYGLLANSIRSKRIERCRSLLGAPKEAQDCSEAPPWQELLFQLTGFDVTLCPCCKTGHLVSKVVIPKRSDHPGWRMIKRGRSP